MKYRDKQKLLHETRAKLIFGKAAARMGGLYNKKPRSFCLPDKKSADNLHESIRNAAVNYFAGRQIPWHDGKPLSQNGKIVSKAGWPSNHVCCSQTQCANALFPFRSDPDALCKLLCSLNYDAVRVLPIINDGKDSEGYVAFEWIGEHNYLGEHARRRPARCDQRSRGKGFTSADFAIRFRDKKEHIHIVLGEWKYTEEYRRAGDLATGKSGPTRVAIYEPLIKPSGIRRPRGTKCADLLYEPFYQMLRQQLLAAAMEEPRASTRLGEMDAHRVSVLHVSPAGNRELRDVITAPKLAKQGKDIYEVWSKLAPTGRFQHVDSERLIELSTTIAVPKGSSGWAKWMRTRYRD